MQFEERRSWTLLYRSERTESRHVREFMHSSPSSERDRKRDGGPRQREPYTEVYHTPVCIPGYYKHRHRWWSVGYAESQSVAVFGTRSEGSALPRLTETLRESLARGARAALSLRPFCPRAFVNCNSDTDGAALLHRERQREKERDAPLQNHDIPRVHI